MPDNLPAIPGVELAARYLAAGEGTEVGGDFYDIYRAGESTWGLAIGDVRGKGPRAAAVTALTRYTLRTASLSETTPSRILATLNEAMLRQRSDDRFCTVAYASIEPNPRGGVSMKLGVGGHPLPLLLRRDGTVERVGSPGTLIGLVPDPDIVDDAVDLDPGESLILYTDGVSEARSDEDGLFGEERLIDLLRSCADQGASSIAEQIEQRVLEFQDHANRDDLAVLVMRVNRAAQARAAAAPSASARAAGARRHEPAGRPQRRRRARTGRRRGAGPARGRDQVHAASRGAARTRSRGRCASRSGARGGRLRRGAARPQRARRGAGPPCPQPSPELPVSGDVLRVLGR